MDPSVINPDDVRIGDVLLVRLEVVSTPRPNDRGSYTVLLGANIPGRNAPTINADWSIVAEHQRRFAVDEWIVLTNPIRFGEIGRVLHVHGAFAFVIPEGESEPEVWPMADCELARHEARLSVMPPTPGPPSGGQD